MTNVTCFAKTQGWFYHDKVEIPVADLKHVFDVLDDDDDGGEDPDNRVGWGLLYFGTPPLIAMNATISMMPVQRYVVGSKHPVFPYCRGWSSTQ